LHARNHVTSPDAIAGLELDTKNPTRHRCGDDEAIAHTRTSFFIDRDGERTARHGPEVSHHGSRPQRHRDEASDDNCREQQATIRE
jgi:hypothetical protein